MTHSTLRMEAGVLRWEREGDDAHARDKVLALAACLAYVVVFWVTMLGAWTSWFGEAVVHAPRRAGLTGWGESEEEEVRDEEERAVPGSDSRAQARRSNGSLPDAGRVHHARPRSFSGRSKTDSAQCPGSKGLGLREHAANRSLPDMDNWMQELKRVARQRRVSLTSASPEASPTVGHHEREVRTGAAITRNATRVVLQEPARSRQAAPTKVSSALRRQCPSDRHAGIMMTSV